MSICTGVISGMVASQTGYKYEVGWLVGLSHECYISVVVHWVVVGGNIGVGESEVVIDIIYMNTRLAF